MGSLIFSVVPELPAKLMVVRLAKKQEASGRNKKINAQERERPIGLLLPAFRPEEKPAVAVGGSSGSTVLRFRWLKRMISLPFRGQTRYGESTGHFGYQVWMPRSTNGCLQHRPESRQVASKTALKSSPGIYNEMVTVFCRLSGILPPGPLETSNYSCSMLIRGN
jgi:hypothetical protein